MNFLAHIYLSGKDDDVKIGNFIGDYVKGNDYLDYSENIKKGIILHRNIDHFTDHSPITHKAKALFLPVFHKYAGIIVDMVYDHVLANEWSKYTNQSLESFIEDFHQLAENRIDDIPDEIGQFIPKLIKNQRLLSYRDVSGLKYALKAMTTYTSLPDHIDQAIEILESNNDWIIDNFNSFFQKMIHYVENVHSINLTGIEP